MPSQVNCTPATPEVTCPVTTGSFALAETVKMPETFAPEEGEVIETVGEVVSGEGGGGGGGGGDAETVKLTEASSIRYPPVAVWVNLKVFAPSFHQEAGVVYVTVAAVLSNAAFA